MMTVVMGLDTAVSNSDLLERLGIAPEEARVFARMIARGVNTPWTSSLGRLFDGIAALLLGLGRSGYDGEAAMRLEAEASECETDPIDIPLIHTGPADQVIGDRSILRGDWRPLVAELWKQSLSSARIDRTAARFHSSIAHWGTAIATLMPGRAVALGGGCFQNKKLRELLTRELRRAGRTVLAATRIPPGDGGLAAGQLAVAMTRLAGHS
jgi:hydrogenase maturation protein HypF